MAMRPAAQQFQRAHGICASGVRFAPQAVLQILDPDDVDQRGAVPECSLVGKDQADRFCTCRDRAGGSTQMLWISPLVVIVEKAQIIAARLGGTAISPIARPVPMLGTHQRQHSR